jgi:hypothetical protein
MPAAYDLLASKKRVNVLKKVKVQGTWKLCPTVVEANGKLRERVKVNGHVEVHPEGRLTPKSVSLRLARKAGNAR